MPDPTPTTFFSYSRTDSEFVLRLATDLRNAGAKVWLDQLDIGAGQLWDSAIEAALRASPRQVVVLSPEAVNSQNVMDEVSYALEEHKQVIPVFYRDCQMPFRLRRVQHIDFRTDYDHGLRDLLRTLGVAGPATVPGSPAPLPSQSSAPKVGPVEKSASAASLHLDTIKSGPDRPPVGGNAPGSSKKLLVYGAIVLVAALAVGIWYLVRPTGQYDDSKIILAITNKISGDGRVTDKNIDIKFSQGVVELSGKVSSDLARNSAGDDAAQVAGVKTVVNNLQIVPGLRTVGGPIAHNTPTTVPTPPPSTPTPAIAPVAVPADQVWIVNANSGMCLSPAGGNDHLNDPIVQFFCDRDPSRGWYFMVEHGDVVKIKNFSNSLCLAVAAPPNFKPEQYTYDSDLSRLWRFVPVNATTFRLG
jgi:TIR domain-containing protein/BON domain-containing protein/ricin-type beta-trefoil lectin protein